MTSSIEKFQNSQWQKLEELNFSKKTIIGLLNEGTVLDVGCGDGLLLENLKNKGISGRGIDISSEAVRICKERGIDCSQKDITEPLPFDDSSFDNIVLADVLEHLFQPLEVLFEAHRVCKKNIFISVPNFASLPARLQVLLGKVPENNTPRDGHVYWMTHNVILGLISKSSFEIEKIVYNTFWQNIPFVGFLTNRLKNIFPSIFALSFVIKARKI